MTYFFKKKQRGQRRKLAAMLRNIESFVPYERRNTDREYECFKVPSDMFIEYPKTSSKIKTEFCRKWLKAAERFIKQKPEDVGFCKVVAVICMPNLWCSQITIFYDEKYYSTFFDRHDPYQTWTPIQEGRSLLAERNIVSVLSERGYREVIVDEDYTYEGELWFYGEL